MNSTGIKRTAFVILILLLVGSIGYSQNAPDFKKEMIESGEKFVVPEEFKTSPGDYESFLKSKLLNRTSSENSIFINPKELGISSIGGRVRASLIDKTNQIYLVAPSGGGLWKFNAMTNQEFEPLNDFGSFMAITDISQNPFNPQHILIGTGDGLHGIPGNGAFESKDGGKTFLKLNSVDPGSNSDFRYIRFIKFSPFDNKTAYLTTTQRLYKSTDLGLNWVEVFNSANANIRSLDFMANDAVIIGVDRMGIFISPNGNPGSFNLVTTNLPNDGAASGGDIDGVVAATHAANRNIAYAFFTGTSNDVYKTTDNGASWTLFPQPDFYVAQSWFCLTIGVHPVNPNIVILGSVLWAYTTDGGVTWKEGAELEVDFHSVHFHASDPDVAYLGYDQGLGRVDFNKYVEYWTWNGSKYVLESQPEQLEIGKNAQFNTSQIYYGDYFPEEYGDAYLQGQQDGGCFGKVGINSSRIVVGDGGSVFINKQNPNKAFASTQLGRLYTTSSAVPPEFNYSRIDTFYNNHPNWITQFDGNNTDGNQVYFSDKENIQRTADGGLTFKSIATHALNYVKIAVQDAVDPIVYAVGYNSNNGKLDLITVMNAATNPTVSTNNDLLANYYGSPDHIEIDPNDANSIFLTTASGNAFKISDIDSETLTINSLKGDIEDVVFNTVIGVKNKPEILIAGTNIGLFYSTNSGSNWFLSNEIPYAQITDLKLRESDMRLFVFTFGRGSWAVTINTYPDVVQKIVLNAGWNIFSSNIYPSYPDLERISQSLIVGGTLDKIQEEAGNSFENWGIYGGWVNNIGDVLPTEGYKIKVSYKDSIEIIGRPIKYPLAIPLQSGWNIIGYGQTESYNGMDNITKQLIEKGSLIKVQDERGNSIEDWGIYGDWINNIGDFMPGEGYKIKVNKDDTLWIYESYPKSTDILPEQITLTHFIPEYQGNGVDHMNINLVGLSSNLMKEGDELAVFDGNTCVGAVTLTSNHLNNQMVSIAASASDKRGTPGFVEGNPILLKLWSTQKNMELLLEPEIVKGPVTFLKHKTTIGNLDNKTTTGLEKILKENITINCYPNPFSEKVSIEFNLEKESEISAEVINQMGQCVKFLSTNQTLNSGLHKIIWDGRNSLNQKISSGIYNVKVNISGTIFHRKIVFNATQ